MPKPQVGLVPDIDEHPYWTKYRRFLCANEIPFEIYDIHRSTWLRDAQRFDMVVWRPSSYPYELEECRRKVHILERELGTICYPSLAEAQLYEDKITQYELLRHHGLPVIDTFISSSEAETLEHLATCDYPLVWKLTAGSGSLGVELLRDRRTAERWARRVFDFSGRRTYWPYVGQKNYVYLQRLELNQGSDVRVVIVGDKVFGYYRDVPKGEFGAPGMGLVRKQSLPHSAVLMARRATVAVDAPCLAVDCLIDPSGERVLILEVSSFIQMETPEQMLVDGEPGWLEGSDLRFVRGRDWLQELALEQVFLTRWLFKREADPRTFEYIASLEADAACVVQTGDILRDQPASDEFERGDLEVRGVLRQGLDARQASEHTVKHLKEDAVRDH